MMQCVYVYVCVLEKHDSSFLLLLFGVVWYIFLAFALGVSLLVIMSGCRLPVLVLFNKDGKPRLAAY